MKRILGLDVGDKKIGIALSDISQLVATPYNVLRVDNQNDAVRYIAQLCAEKDIERIIVGLPGERGKQVEKITLFVQKLRKAVAVPIEFIEESLTTNEANMLRIQLGKKKKKRQEDEDAIAAALILNDYLVNLVQ